MAIEPKKCMPLTFIDANILFKMFAVTPSRMEKYNSSGTSGSRGLDYAIKILLSLNDEMYSTSELALLEACGVASREAGNEKARSLLKVALEEESLAILDVRAITYPLAFSFVLGYGFETRDALHLGVAVLARVSRVLTSDDDFADRIDSLIKEVRHDRIRIPSAVQAMYCLSDKEIQIVEKDAMSVLTNLETLRAPP